MLPQHMSMHLEVTGQFAGVCPFLLPCGSQGSSSEVAAGSFKGLRHLASSEVSLT